MTYHEQKYQGHPLVVGQLFRFSAGVVDGDWCIHRNVVRVLYPAVAFGVVNIGPSELGWTPAMDGVSHELPSADHDCEQRQEKHCPYMVEPVHPVIVAGSLELFQGGNTSDNRSYRPVNECKCLTRYKIINYKLHRTYTSSSPLSPRNVPSIMVCHVT